MILKHYIHPLPQYICFRGTKNVMILKLNVKLKSNSKSFRGTKNVMILKPVGSTGSGKSGFRGTKNVMILKLLHAIN